MSNVDSFEEFFRAEYPRLARGVYLVTRDRDEAEELAQEAMARIFERWDRVSAMESPTGYAFRTAMNLNRKRIRRLALAARKLVASPEPQEDPSETIAAAADVHDALDSLSHDQLQAILLVEWFGLTSEEAASVLGIEAVSVRGRIHRARAALRERMGPLTDVSE